MTPTARTMSAAPTARRPGRRDLSARRIYCSPLGKRLSGHRVLQATQFAERLPCAAMTSGIEDLVVRPPKPQPGIHATPQPGVGPEVPIRHLEVRQLRGVEHLAF